MDTTLNSFDFKRNRSRFFIMLSLIIFIFSSYPSYQVQGAEKTGPLIIANDIAVSNNQFWSNLRDLTGKETPKIAVFLSGEDSYGLSVLKYYQTDDVQLSVEDFFKKYQFAPFFVPVAVNYRAQANDPTLLKKIEEADVIWFYQGISAANHLDVLYNEKGEEGELLKAIKRANSKGAIVGGENEGGLIFNRYVFGSSSLENLYKGTPLREYKTILDKRADLLSNYFSFNDRAFKQGVIMKGLGFTDCVMTIHAQREGRVFMPLLPMRDYKINYGVSLERGSAVLIKDGLLTVLGDEGSGIVILDQKKSTNKSGAQFVGDNYNFHRLTDTDSFGLKDGLVKPSFKSKTVTKKGFMPDQNNFSTFSNFYTQLTGFASYQQARMLQSSQSINGINITLTKTKDTKIQWDDATFNAIGLKLRLDASGLAKK